MVEYINQWQELQESGKQTRVFMQTMTKVSKYSFQLAYKFTICFPFYFSICQFNIQ